MTHSLLFLAKPMEQLANPNAELLSHLFVALIPPRISVDDEVIQLAMWLRDRRTYQFQWNEQPITDSEPWTTEEINREVELIFTANGGTRLNLQRWFARKTTLYVDDLSRLMYACFKLRYGSKEAATAWGMRCLQWATVEVDLSDHGTVFKARQIASRALRLYCIVAEPLTLKVVTMILQTIIRGLKASETFWSSQPPEQRYMRADNDLLLAVRAIETLTIIVQTKKEWSKSLFRVILVIFWVALSLLQLLQEELRLFFFLKKKKKNVDTTAQWITWLFQHAKNADGTRIRKDSGSLTMFWDLYKTLQPNFQGIQERLLSSLTYSIGESSPVPLSVDAMMILTCCWLVRCDVLHDRNVHSRVPANIAFFLPYACAVLHPQYFSMDQLGHHIAGFKDSHNTKYVDRNGVSVDGKNPNDLLHIEASEDDDQDELDTVDPIERAEILRKRAEVGKKLREKNARMFTLLALYLQQNIVEENVNLGTIDFDNQDHLSKYPVPSWSKIDSNFRSIYVSIYDVITHIANTLKACLTSEEPSIHHALGDFCQALIDLFIPSQAATLARVFAICLDIGDNLQKLGCIQALQLFVPRLLKQCKQLSVFQEVISVWFLFIKKKIENHKKCKSHEFVLLLTKNEYKATAHKSRVMVCFYFTFFYHHMCFFYQSNLYPPFKHEHDLFEDGMSSTLSNLSQILEKATKIIAKYPDDMKIDPKVRSILERKRIFFSFSLCPIS
ncbi:hypothetical protein RFI_25192 [Reticulomyxa filosa]|uniref:Uncharacterized protein n=1 Tax=Reticulomyxa filosa TaxID=46433 RepID=X6ME57_RETFI|nr:hypothetical protein RFI_25192 [Reticulomyxa filosa]|eukprot:ETO12189.1 hypothetical protein RFI_25192 [Reticulomyxa filosa]